MASIVTMDRAGRILLPATARKELRLRPGSKILLTEMEDGRLVLIPLDVDEIAKRIQKEMKGADIGEELAKVRRDIQELARERYPELARQMKKRR